nr:hypothetical protein CFP56_09380 [Quercus suber]
MVMKERQENAVESLDCFGRVPHEVTISFVLALRARLSRDSSQPLTGSVHGGLYETDSTHIAWSASLRLFGISPCSHSRHMQVCTHMLRTDLANHSSFFHAISLSTPDFRGQHGSMAARFE